ncbi:LOB domain-containing protein 24-like [Aristolochia californica]|uniref:LOB domain-containing protein 24-like n=1 Tax=Aristolochia californica TaxID=171875 RepID=UPI0035DC9EF4
MSKNETTCAACKRQRRTCSSDCPLRPYFAAEPLIKEYEHLHRLFRPDYMRKLVRSIEPPLRDDAVRALVFEADAWISDPVHGCLGNINDLQNNIKMLEMELTAVQRLLELCRYQRPIPPPLMIQAKTGAGDQLQHAFTSSGAEQFDAAHYQQLAVNSNWARSIPLHFLLPDFN